MKPTDFAFLEISAWQQALTEQRKAERMQEEARRSSEAARFYALRKQVKALRQRAALLLASAVEKKLSFHSRPGK